MRIKSKFILLFISFITICNVYSQSNFAKGYNVGYQKGFCYSQGYGCTPPLPPLPPLPNIYENGNSYNDGYNRGFSDGQNANQNKSNNNPFVNNNNSPFSGQSSYGSVKPEYGQMNLYTPDYEHLNNVYKAAQDRYNNAQANTHNQYNRSQQNAQKKSPSNLSLENEKSLEKYSQYITKINIHNRKLRIENLVSTYNSMKVLPSHVKNGVYKAKLISKSENSLNEFYETCNVYVIDNNIYYLEYDHFLDFKIQFIKNEYYPPNVYVPEYQYHILSGEIINGRSLITVEQFNASVKGLLKVQFEVLLLDYIADYIKTQQEIKKVRNNQANYQISNVTGWFKGFLSDRNILCEERDFYIENGVVKKWIGKTGFENKVDSGGKIIEGRTSVSVVRPPIYQNLPNSPLGKNSYELYDIYFVK